MDGSDEYTDTGDTDSECELHADPLEMAVNAVIHGGMQLRQAQKQYNVPYTTLRWRVKNGKEGQVKRGRKPVLSENTEKTIVKAALALKDNGLGLSRKEVLFVASEKDRRAEPNDRVFSSKGPTSSWFRRFKKRNNLSVRLPENKSIARYGAESNEQIVKI